MGKRREGVPYLKRTSFLAGAGATGLGLADDDDANSSGRQSWPGLCGGALSPLSDGLADVTTGKGFFYYLHVGMESKTGSNVG